MCFGTGMADDDGIGSDLDFIGDGIPVYAFIGGVQWGFMERGL